MFKAVPLTFTLYSEVLKLYSTLLINTANADRSFSALRQVKIYLRSHMIQERCNNVVLLRCHKNKTDLPDMPAIMKDFVM